MKAKKSRIVFRSGCERVALAQSESIRSSVGSMIEKRRETANRASANMAAIEPMFFADSNARKECALENLRSARVRSAQSASLLPVKRKSCNRLEQIRLDTAESENCKPHWIFLLLCVALFGGAGCGTLSDARTQDIGLGRRFSAIEVPAGKCRVVVCWPSDKNKASGIQPNVIIQGTDVGVLKPMGYLDVLVEPGDVAVSVKFEDVRLGKTFRGMTNVQATANSEAYIVYDPAPRTGDLINAIWVPSMSFKIVPTTEGRELGKRIFPR